MSELKPGRELDILVAEKVFRRTGEYLAEDIAEDVVPDYSTDIGTAWQVVEKMQSNDWAVILDNMDGYLGNWQAHFEKDHVVETADSESAPHAICLAALKAVGL